MCIICEGIFTYNEKVFHDIHNNTYCEACYKEWLKKLEEV